MKRCIYSVILPPDMKVCCNVYSYSKRPDGKWWAHWPACSGKNCPFGHPELLEGAVFNKEEYDNAIKRAKERMKNCDEALD